MDYRQKFRDLRTDNDLKQEDIAKICNDSFYLIRCRCFGVF